MTKSSLESETESESEMTSPEDDRQMSFWEHFAELRMRLTRAVIGVTLGFAIAFYFVGDLTLMLQKPLVDAWGAVHEGEFAGLTALGIQSPLMADFRVAMTAAIFIAGPIIFYQLWMFIAPGLYRREKRLIIPFVLTSVGMFLLGGWFAYRYVLPYAYQWLLEYAQHRGEAVNLEVAEYFKGASRILIAFGVVFEFPLLIAFFSKMGLVTHRTLLKFWKVAVVVIFVLAAFLTPPEPMTQFMMAVPMVLLFFVSVIVAYVLNPASRQEEVVETDAETVNRESENQPGA